MGQNPSVSRCTCAGREKKDSSAASSVTAAAASSDGYDPAETSEPSAPMDCAVASTASAAANPQEAEQTAEAEAPIEPPAVSILQHFSAPVILPVPPGPIALKRHRSAPAGKQDRLRLPVPPLDRARSAQSALVTLRSGRQCFTELTLKRLISVTSGPPKVNETLEASIPGSTANAEDTDVEFGRDLQGDSAPGMVPAEDKTTCLICREEPPAESDGLFLPERLCRSRRSCEGAFCRPCLQGYYLSTLEASRYTVPFMRCPSCRGYIRAASWANCVDTKAVEAMAQNAQDLLALRCMECDEPQSLLVPYIQEEERRRDVAAKALDDLPESQRVALLRWWARYSCGEEEALQGLLLLSPPADAAESSAPETSQSDPEDGKPPAELETRMHRLLSLIEDSSRRAVLQLAFLRRWPKTKTACCDKEHCFKCKVGSHHEGVSCEDVQRKQLQVEGGMQFCPGCGVATVKTEGCNAMICICGEEWTWQGDEVWVEDWLPARLAGESPTSRSSGDGSPRAF